MTASLAPPSNLLQGDDATFSASIGTWSNYSNASLQWAPNSGEGGGGGLALTSTGPTMVALSGASGNGGLTPATPGSIYSGSLSAVAPLISQTIQPALVFYSSSGTVITTVFGTGAKVSTSWAHFSPVVAISPTNTAYVALGIVDYNATAGAAVTLDNAWIEKTAEATTPSVVGPLSTSGNKIMQANGLPLVPRGVVLNGLETSPTAPGVTEQAVVQAKTWGANIVRLPLGEQFWLSTNCDYSPTYQATVNQVVNWITSLGMVALLDLHTNTVLGCQTGTPHNMADEAQSPTFWSQVAAQYASNPLVAFDLYNEPHDVSSGVWLNGGITVDHYPPFLVYQAAGMQQLYNSVRLTGAQNLVFISGLSWAEAPPSQLVVGNNIVYAAHIYTCQTLPPACANPTPYDPSALIKPWAGLSAYEPVAITEFGWPSQYDVTYTANVINDAGAVGLGWMAFAWEDVHDPAPFDITGRWVPDLPAEPAPSGVPVLCELVRVSTGSSPCVPPPIGSSSTPTVQTATPLAPARSSGPAAKSPATASVLRPASAAGLGASIPASTTRVGDLATGATRNPAGRGTTTRAFKADQITVGKSVFPGWASTFAVRMVALLLALGSVLVPAFARRVRRPAATNA